MSDITLQSIAAKLLQTRKFTALNKAELVWLHTASGLPVELPEADGERPLLAWTFPRIVRFWPWVSDTISSDFELDGVLEAAGLTPSSEIRGCSKLLAPTTRETFSGAIERVLRTSEGLTLRPVLTLAGLTGFRELIDPICRCLERLTERGSYSFVTHGASGAIVALAMNGEESAAPLVARYLRSHDDSVRESVYLYYELVPDSIADKDLIPALQNDPKPNGWMQFPGLFNRAAKCIDMEPVITAGRAQLSPASSTPCLATIASTAVAHTRSRLFESLLDDSDDDLKIELLSAACWSGRNDLVPSIRKKVAQSDNLIGYGFLGAVACETIEYPGDHKVRQDMSAGGNTTIKALWLALGRQGFEDEILAATHHSDDSIRCTARLIHELNHGADPVELQYLVGMCESTRMILPMSFLVRAFHVREIPLPPSLRHHTILGETWDIDRAAAFYAEHPVLLLGALSFEDTPAMMPGLRAYGGNKLQMAALLLKNPMITRHMEAVLPALPNQVELGLISAIIEVTTGIRSNGIRELVALIRANQKRPLVVGINSIPAIAAIGATTSFPIAAACVRSVVRSVDEPEDYIALLLANRDNDALADVAADCCKDVDSDMDPLFADIRKLLFDKTVTVSDLNHLERAVMCNSPEVRKRAAQVIGSLPSHIDRCRESFLTLCTDRSPDVRRAAISSLGPSAQAPFVQRMLLDKSYPECESFEEAIHAMGESRHDVFLPRLLDLLVADKNQSPGSLYRGDSMDKIVVAIEKISIAHPELAYITLVATTPRDIIGRYQLAEEVDWRQDSRQDALRLYVLAYEKLADAAFAREKQGARVLLTPVTALNARTQGLQQGMNQQTFERLAAFLEVSYVDEQSHTILATVVENPGSQIVNALFEGASCVVFQAGWA